MYLLKFLVALIVSLTFLIVECCFLKRVVNRYGLFEPKIELVDIPPNMRNDPPAASPVPQKAHTYVAQEVPMYLLLRNVHDEIPVITYIPPQFDFHDGFKEAYNFRLNKFSAMDTQKHYYALELHSEVNPMAQSYLDSRAYWCPQGKYVDIPIDPTIRGDPKYVFTPTFSGCTMVVDLIEKEVSKEIEKVFRVYHVQGGKENAEYNVLDDHGYGMVTSMQYRHYGYFRPDLTVNLLTENYIGSAFMAWSEQTNKWILYYQSQLGSHGFSISEISTENGVKKITAYTPDNVQVVKSSLHSVRAIVDQYSTAPFQAARSVKKIFVAEVHKELNYKRSDSKKFNCV